ncbi:hypothetical protein LKM00_26435 [Bacillus wiedmannii]|uniref:hypothetical protein n=1 Tax=Bacillus wiedmannii TaxID=1890302 RepID=UPI001E3B0A7F|nr:hypothetical protein [Bacillus wiedmannii]MCC2380938.1 hypothetical protein [Bacillus wiedmannii]MCC2425352.1 hypothetical protein [Bacillus wiedmannii]
MSEMVGYIYIKEEFEELFGAVSQAELHFLTKLLPFVDEDGLIYIPKDDSMKEIELASTKGIIDYWGVSKPTATKYLRNLVEREVLIKGKENRKNLYVLGDKYFDLEIEKECYESVSCAFLKQCIIDFHENWEDEFLHEGDHGTHNVYPFSFLLIMLMHVNYNNLLFICKDTSRNIITEKDGKQFIVEKELKLSNPFGEIDLWKFSSGSTSKVNNRTREKIKFFVSSLQKSGLVHVMQFKSIHHFVFKLNPELFR